MRSVFFFFRRFVFASICCASSGFLSGCSNARSGPDTFIVRDSAGIEIVESSAPLLGPDAWAISEEPVLQIGEVEGEDPYLFARVGGVREGLGKVFRSIEGHIVVCNGMDRTIRFFDEAGVFLKSVGGDGDGPGEFRNITSCGPTPNGFVVLNGGIASYFDGDGTFRRTLQARPIDGGLAFIEGVFSDESLLVRTVNRVTLDLGPGVHASTYDFFVVSSDGEPGSRILNEKATSYVVTANRSLAQAFGTKGELAVLGQELLYGWSGAYEIGAFDPAGMKTRSLRRKWDLAPVTEEDQDWWASFRVNLGRDFLGNDSPDRRRAYQRQVDMMDYPDNHPVFDRIVVSRIGEIWVRHQHPRYDFVYWLSNVRFPHSWTWDVFDPQGRWLTSLTPPSSMEIHDIGEDYILGVWKDEMDVEYVRMYSLDRGG